MVTARLRAACWIAVMLLVSASVGRADYPRRTAIVEAVEKTRAGIVTIKVEKPANASRDKESFGTGVVVDDRGYIITNHHVISSATSVVVYLADGKRYTARVVAHEVTLDLAILRLVAEHKDGLLPALHALSIGPGSDVMVGETVIAVGSPYGYTHTVSTGIVSALGREIQMPSGELLKNLIQTNASINPGNSGGPLLNVNGEVIGLNVALRQGAQGIAFAINADTVKQFLIRHLSALRISGVQHGLVCSEKVLPEGATRQRVVVLETLPRTAAASAGVQPGDEVRRVGERIISNRFDLERALWDRKAGEEVVLALERGGKELKVQLKLAGTTDGHIATTSPDAKSPTSTPAAGSTVNTGASGGMR